MIRPFDRSIWTRPGVPFVRHEPERPFADAANRAQYLRWDLPQSWFTRFRSPTR
jgi:hypothetical protein